MSAARLERGLAAISAGGFAAWALLDPSFRDGQGALDGAVCLPLGLALAALTITLGRRPQAPLLPPAARWLALAIAGQSAALRLIDAGPRLHYQHYPPVHQLASADRLALCLVAIQAVVVIAGLTRARRRLAAWLAGVLSPLQLAAAGAVFVMTSAALSESVPTYLGELIVAAAVQAINLGNALLFGLALPAALLRRLSAWARGAVAKDGGRRLAAGAALWVTLVAAVIAHQSYERHPHITDEVAYHLHARFLAAGRLRAPAPPVAAAFPLFLMATEGDDWAPATSPGWPAILALGFVVGLPWLVNPLLAGLNLLLAHRLLRRLYDGRTAGYTVLLLAASPWYVLMAINFMTHTATLTCALGAALAVVKARPRRDAAASRPSRIATGAVAWAVVAGILAAAIGLIRPLDAIVVATLLGLWALGLGGRRLRPAAVAAMAAGGAAVGVAVLAYNRLMTGSATSFPVMRYLNARWGAGANRLGFGPDRGAGWPLDPFPGHAPVDALVNAALNAFSINVELFGWAAGSLALAVILVFSRPLARSDRLLLTVIAAVFSAHFFYFYSGGPDFGARYWFLMVVPLAALTVRGAIRVSARMAERAPRTPGGEPLGEIGGARLGATIAALALAATLLYVPWRAIDKYHRLWGMRPDVRELAARHGFEGEDLVLIRGAEFPDYASAAVYNPVDLTSKRTVYAWDESPETRAAVVAAYPGRRVWVVAGPTLTGAGYEVVAAPAAVAEP